MRDFLEHSKLESNPEHIEALLLSLYGIGVLPQKTSARYEPIHRTFVTALLNLPPSGFLVPVFRRASPVVQYIEEMAEQGFFKPCRSQDRRRTAYEPTSKLFDLISLTEPQEQFHV